jgi:hypothetical protein
MKKLIVFIAGLTLFTGVFSQEKVEKPMKNNEFGFNLGATTGLGLSYRRWIGRVGFQITGLPVKTDNTTFYSAAFTTFYNFNDSRLVRVYGFLGNNYIESHHIENSDNWSFGYPDTEEVLKSNYSYNIGIGPGFAFGKVVRFNLMVGYGFFDVLEDVRMFPTVEIGLYYNFGK